MFLKLPRVVLWPTYPSVKWVIRDLSPVVQQPGHEDSYSNHLMPRLRISGSIPLLPIFLQGIYLYIYFLTISR
jgi:hypothetical protein